MLDLTTVRVNL